MRIVLSRRNLRNLSLFGCTMAVILAFSAGLNASDCQAKEPAKPPKKRTLANGEYLLFQSVVKDSVAPPQPDKGTMHFTKIKLTVTGETVVIEYIDADAATPKGLKFKGTLVKNTITISDKARRGLTTYKKRLTGKLTGDNTLSGILQEHKYSLGGADPILKTTFQIVPIKK